jgi:phenylpyruvate tautomerase PptA (4-oxalocrotonate tautomerase family)
MIKVFIIFLVSIVFFPGCNQHHPCVKNHINPAFIGFSTADIDTLVLRAYQPNDNYQHLVDTILVINLNATIYTTKNDTTVVYVNDSNPDHWVSPGFDWQIYIPAKNRTISISNIVSTQTEGPGRACWNPINSFAQDGQLIVPQHIQTGQFYTSGYMAYIH